jgi:hypothetical protein
MFAMENIISAFELVDIYIYMTCYCRQSGVCCMNAENQVLHSCVCVFCITHS